VAHFPAIVAIPLHHKKSLTDVFGSEMAAEVWDRFTVHYTPTHGSWLNQAEIETGIFSRQCLGNRRIPNLKTLRQEAKAWNRRMNRERVKIAWKFDRKAARRTFDSITNGTPPRGQRPSRLKPIECPSVNDDVPTCGCIAG